MVYVCVWGGEVFMCGVCVCVCRFLCVGSVCMWVYVCVEVCGGVAQLSALCFEKDLTEACKDDPDF